MNPLHKWDLKLTEQSFQWTSQPGTKTEKTYKQKTCTTRTALKPGTNPWAPEVCNLFLTDQ